MEDTYAILENLYKTTCLVYERCAYTGRNVHEYNNRKQTAWSALKLFKLTNNARSEQIARKAMIDLVKWVGGKVSEANAGRQSNNYAIIITMDDYKTHWVKLEEITVNK